MTPDEARTSAEQWIQTLCQKKAEALRKTMMYQLIHPSDNERWLNETIEGMKVGLYFLLKESKTAFAPVMYKITGILWAMDIDPPYMRRRKDFLPFLDAAIEALEQQVHEYL